MSGSALIAAHQLVVDIRKKHDFASGDQLKFQTKSRPKEMSIENWTAAKTELVSRASEIPELDLIAYVILHNIAKSSGDQLRVEYALNALIAHFDMRYLPPKKAYGTVVVDRLDAKFGFGYMRKRFGEPFDLPDGRSVALERVALISQTCDGASHLSSLVDIVLGGFRYCVNTAMGKGNDAVANDLFPPLAKMLWGRQEGDTKYIGGYGYLKYPKLVKAPPYQEKYDQLTTTLSTYGSSTETPATDEPVS
jgi:hypothetical protein